jgi:hypothetical protein
MNRLVTRFGLMLLVVLMLIAESSVIHAQAEQIFMTVAFNPKVIGIGKTAKLEIVLSNARPNPIRVTSLTCTQSGTAVTASTISPIPTTLGVEETFFATQTYRGVSVGTATVNCHIIAVDTVTGETVNGSNHGPAIIDVITEVGLAFTAYTSSQVATVGQSVFVIAKFVNRGKTAYTNLTLSCPQLGRTLGFVSSTPLQSTLPPGQSGFVQYHLQAIRKGETAISCIFTGIESVSGKQVSIAAPLIGITVK